MNFIKKITSLTLITVLLGTSGIFLPAQAKSFVEPISFKQVEQSEMNMDKLALKTDGKITLFENGKTDFAIILPENCTEELLKAASSLQEVLCEMTDSNIEIISENKASTAKKHILIDTALNTKRPAFNDADDGFHITVSDEVICICGADSTATANGIYTFIEDTLGCMFLTPDDTYTPKQKSIYIEKTDTNISPKTKWRDVYAYETTDNNWGKKLRLNGIKYSSNETQNIEQMQYEGWGTWCHDCYDYLSPDEYYETHPEYFSQVFGKRVTTYRGRDAYLCLSNPEVFKIVKNAMAKKMAEQPDKLYWDFSGSDNPFLAGCRCKKCKKADKAAGGTGMGTLLPFLNKLARAFPDKYICTLAYLHTLKAPKNIKAEPNVVIKLCSMPGDQASSYFDGGNADSAEFKEQVKQWAAITDNIVVWDYVVNFKHLLLPFPNFAVQAKNQRFYEENNIIGVFHQASREIGGEFSCLRSYVLSRIMWDGSQTDVAKYVSKYITAYYGPAAAPILEYMNSCATQLQRSNKSLGLYDRPMKHFSGYLSQGNINDYLKKIEQAKQLAGKDKTLISRIEEVELSVIYAQSLLPGIGKAKRQKILDRINSLCEKRDITMVCEWESLKDFNNKTLRNTVLLERLELAAPYAAAVIIIAAVGITVKAVKKKKKKKQSAAV